MRFICSKCDTVSTLASFWWEQHSIPSFEKKSQSCSTQLKSLPFFQFLWVENWPTNFTVFKWELEILQFLSNPPLFDHRNLAIFILKRNYLYAYMNTEYWRSCKNDVPFYFSHWQFYHVLLVTYDLAFSFNDYHWKYHILEEVCLWAIRFFQQMLRRKSFIENAFSSLQTVKHLVQCCARKWIFWKCVLNHFCYFLFPDFEPLMTIHLNLTI